MRKLLAPLFVLSLLAACAAPSGVETGKDKSQIGQEQSKPEFGAWLAAFRKEAGQSGISEETLALALDGVQPIPRVVELDRVQPEFKPGGFRRYMDGAVSLQRVDRGRQLIKANAALLKEISAKYGVPARFIVALWGIETNFGRVTGGFPVIPALATLAYDGRRSSFFRGELLDALKIVDQGHIAAAAMTGSWAGAMGQVQFMPSSFLKYAVDEDGDGRRDIWGSTPDALASAANYLSRLGWRDDIGWGRKVSVPPNLNDELLSLEVRKSLDDWSSLGLLNEEGQPLPKRNITASLIRPESVSDERFLVYDNYRIIMKWNRSHFFALAVGHLADRIGSP